MNIKMFSLAVVAALAMTAIAGAGSASAITVLCKEKAAKSCPAENIYAGGTAIEAKLKSGTTALFEGAASETCSESTLTGKTTAKSGNPLPVEITGLTMSSCKSTCSTVTARNLPYSSTLSASGSGNGTMSLAGSGKGDPGFVMTNCVLGRTCTFGATQISASFAGGNPASLSFKASLKFESGSEFLCGGLAVLNATYEVVKPAPAYLVLEPRNVAFCRKQPKTGELCPPGENMPSGSQVTAKSTNLSISPGPILGESECESTLSGQTTSASGEPLPIKFTTMSIGGCKKGSCEIMKVEKLPYESGLASPEEAIWTLTINTHLQFKFEKCQYAGTYYTCTFESSGNPDLDVTNTAIGMPELHAEKIKLSLTAGTETICGKTNYLTATYATTLSVAGSAQPAWVSLI